MGIKRTKIVLQSERQGTLEFTPGETVRGALVLDVDGGKPHRLKAGLVKVRGKASTNWNESSGNGVTHYCEKQWLLRRDLPLRVASDGRPPALTPGQHRLPFTFTLPDRLAHSQDYAKGRVKYKCKARVFSYSFWSFDGRACVKFRVLPQRDLSGEPRLARPLTVQREAGVSLLGRDPGPFQLHLSQRGFAAGEVINVWLDGPERAFEVLSAADDAVQLKARVVFCACSHSTESTRVLAKVRPGRSPAAWRHIQLTVPEEEVTMDDDDSIITVSYYVKVRDARLPVTLGTVPLPPT